MPTPCAAAVSPLAPRLRAGARPAALLAAVAALAGCRTITPDPADSTPPTLTIAQSSPRGGAVPASIALASDRQRIAIVFGATDRESGISRGRADLTISFTCVYVATRTWNPRQTLVPRSLTFASSISGARPGPSSFAAASFSLEDLWREGGCTEWGQEINVHTGVIQSITARYSADAFNNAARPLRGTLAPGSFTVTGASSINLDS
jgi:hypothetical protein